MDKTVIVSHDARSTAKGSLCLSGSQIGLSNTVVKVQRRFLPGSWVKTRQILSGKDCSKDAVHPLAPAQRLIGNFNHYEYIHFNS